ncbi:Ribosomal RNA small subunit methyltransferase G [Sporotomaculum syntrophicum]|uniref:Ribosomal RNA small subunit methyltransferase G n=1 Tax=Sporotomaculum syntrophicum TaxID=182264 RepID=A0A9D2WR48_9FIRM|nr:16S rRNA (guanine(527)-N(7))-methyltransferase RsmG [Sporotomaculum syntrophicum]KAF1085914.1 Ribosomal RNA small subunit methyltransferase G [Sporotomaculum syntrophicum]
MNDLFRHTIQHDCEKLGIIINNDIIDKFELYYQMLYKKNKEINLTTITTPEEAAEKHFIDSLSLNHEIKLLSANNIVDIGSGAGFPGLPLKIYNNDLDMTLVDAVGKKVKFMQQVIQELKLQNVNAIKTRIEDLASICREKYFVAVSRAVADLRVLVEYALPIVRVSGYVIATKGPNINEEIILADRAIKILGGEVVNIRHLTLPISQENRAIITIKKIKPTPVKYPRKAGIPKKRPL